MLKITIPKAELWDEENEEFVYAKEVHLQLEHSLVSISKWESKWHKAFLSNEPKTDEETIDYIRCMTITQNVDPDVFRRLTQSNVDAINEYISDPMTATTFREIEGKRGNIHERVTSEVIYYMMIAFGIPVEFQKWHLNRLLTLIKVCDRKSRQPKKMSQKEIMKQNAALNKARKAKSHHPRH